MRHLILVLDNEFETPGLLREGLTPIGFEVVWVNVAAILDDGWLKKTQFMGIILNFDMRGYLGMTVLEKLREQGVEIPVIVMSSPSNREQLEQAVQEGARDYILKPIDTGELQEKCLRHFARLRRDAGSRRIPMSVLWKGQAVCPQLRLPGCACEPAHSFMTPVECRVPGQVAASIEFSFQSEGSGPLLPPGALR